MSDAIVSTNTSGIPILEFASGFQTEFQRRFLGTHLQSTAILHLLELVPGQLTEDEVVRFVAEFSETVLGKGVVICKRLRRISSPTASEASSEQP